MVDIISSLRTMFIPSRGEGPPPADLPRPSVLRFPTSRQRSNADLARMIESEIIPRLMLAHAQDGRAPEPEVVAIGPRTLDIFTRMTLTSEAHTLTAYIETLIQGGVSLQTVYVDLLIQTARRLGDNWNDDEISFTDVTIGLSRLQQVVRNFSQRSMTRDADPGAPAACFVNAPGEQHVFGLFLLEDGFRRAGWRTWLDTAATREDSVDAVALDWFDVFGLSATSDVEPEVVASTIEQVRKASRNPRLFVMVGGRMFTEAPDMAAAVGADAATHTAVQALSMADEAVKARISA